MSELLARLPRVPVVSATGSTRMGRAVAVDVAQRFSRSILELGGNNAMVVMPSADLAGARAITFAAVGTAGQRCTTLRRLIVHRDVAATAAGAAGKDLRQRARGRPAGGRRARRPAGWTARRFEQMQNALAQAREQGGTVHGGERECQALGEDAWYARPALVRMPAQSAVVQHETFAPILYAADLHQPGRSHRLAERRAPGPVVRHLHHRPARGRALPLQHGQRLRHRQREHRHLGRRDRRAFGGGGNRGGGRESGSDARKGHSAARPTPPTTATLSHWRKACASDV